MPASEGSPRAVRQPDPSNAADLRHQYINSRIAFPNIPANCWAVQADCGAAANNNGIYDAGDFTYNFGGLTSGGNVDTPIVGDWNALGGTSARGSACRHANKERPITYE